VANRKDKKVSIAGAVLLAAVLGLIVGAIIFHDPGTAPLSPDDVEFTGPYDDKWGKLDRPDQRGGVSQIFIKIDAKRNEADAKKLAEQIWHKIKNVNGLQTRWQELQDQYNDEPDKRKIYPFPGGPPELFETGRTTKVGHVRVTKSTKGYHLVRRES
jgi:hypothetical protein